FPVFEEAAKLRVRRRGDMPRTLPDEERSRSILVAILLMGQTPGTSGHAPGGIQEKDDGREGRNAGRDESPPNAGSPRGMSSFEKESEKQRDGEERSFPGPRVKEH